MGGNLKRLRVGMMEAPRAGSLVDVVDSRATLTAWFHYTTINMVIVDLVIGLGDKLAEYKARIFALH